MLFSLLFRNKKEPKASMQLNEPLGLKTLADACGGEDGLRCLSTSVVSRGLLSSPAVPSMHEEKELEEVEEEEEEGCWASYGGKSPARRFPPAMPCLVRTANLACHAPWVMRRTYRDGGLVIEEVPVKHHEYFKSRRENGRLTLELVQLDGLIPFYIAGEPRRRSEDENNHREKSKSKEQEKKVVIKAAGPEERRCSSPPRFSSSSLMALSSSLPEPVCVGFRKGCYGVSPFYDLPMSRLRTVES